MGYRGTIGANQMLVVQETIEGAHPLHPDYPLLSGDMLVKSEDGTFYKFGPGLGILGFVLTPEQEVKLVPNAEDMNYEMGNL